MEVTLGTRYRHVQGDNPAALTIAVLAVAAGAWLAMLAWHGQGHGLSAAAASPHHGMHGHGENPAATAAGETILMWLAGWSIMVVAMMLPPALPFLRTMARLVAKRPDGAGLLLTSAGAFVLVWILAGAALLAAGSLLTPAIGSIEALASRPWLVAGAAALLAGLYQFTPMKRACLNACRSPLSLVLASWRGDAPWRAASSIGLRYGAVCVGCCWALMVLSLLVGALSLPIMVVTALLMAAERMLPAVRPVTAMQAAFACAVGLLLMLGSLTPAQVWP